jgi:hypothetical protein
LPGPVAAQRGKAELHAGSTGQAVRDLVMRLEANPLRRLGRHLSAGLERSREPRDGTVAATSA